jgi:ankyrin repeat protein
MKSLLLLFTLVVLCFADDVKSPLPSHACPDESKRWLNTEFTSAIWQSIASGSFMENLRPQFDQEPCLAHIRSMDGRGPLFWAHEFGRYDIINYLKDRLADEDALDLSGKTPVQMAKTKEFDVGFRPADRM